MNQNMFIHFIIDDNDRDLIACDKDLVKVEPNNTTTIHFRLSANSLINRRYQTIIIHLDTAHSIFNATPFDFVSNIFTTLLHDKREATEGAK